MLGNVPTLQDFQAAGVYIPGASEIIAYNFYDHLIYPLAGQQQLNFFSTPVGQGVTSALGAVVGSPKTSADTNLQLPNQMPQGMSFLITSIEFTFEAGSSAAANTYLAAPVSSFVVAAAAAQGAAANDVDQFRQSGWLEFLVGNKNYVTEGPIGRFPATTGLDITATGFSNSATVGEALILKAKTAGVPWTFGEPIALASGFYFYSRLQWPSALAIPSGFNARVGCFLNGYALRVAQ